MKEMHMPAHMPSLRRIATVRSPFPSKFGIPRQSGLLQGVETRVVLEGEYRNPDALRGLEEFSHLWLLWLFSEAERDGWSPTVRPPRLGGNTRMGVFATRSPFRPNPIGLSSVRLLRIEGCELVVDGADLLDGTPVLDIKPYLPYTDAHPDAGGGFADRVLGHSLQVQLDDELGACMPSDLRAGLVALLSQDPRPSYQNDPQRVYGFPFAGYEVHFTVRDGVLTVTDIKAIT